MIIISNFPFNEKVLSDIENVTKEYDITISAETEYNKPEIKKYLEDGESRKCRFCNKKYPNIKFSSTAHAIPEFMGNKSLISKFECDECNRYFGKFESEFGNFMLPYNSLGGIIKKGNKSVKYKQDITVYESENKLNIENFPTEFPPNTKQVDLSLSIPSYIPDFIYRALVKVGLTLMPEASFGKYTEIVNWLMDMSADTIFPARMLFSIFPYSNPSDKIRCIILDKKQSISREVPQTIFILSYRNFAFQTFFPISTIENMENLYPFPMIVPSILDSNLDLVKRKSCEQIELHEKEKVKGKSAKFILKNLD